METLPAQDELDSQAQKLETISLSSSGLKSRDFNLKTAELIRSQIGDIEEVRKSLGLSQRKICQLLLIDPSTWSRWATGKTAPPPYIYRMLQWGLAVMDKYPEVHPLVQFEKFEQLKRSEEILKRVEDLEKSQGKEETSGEQSQKGFWSFLKF